MKRSKTQRLHDPLTWHSGECWTMGIENRQVVTRLGVGEETGWKGAQKNLGGWGWVGGEVACPVSSLWWWRMTVHSCQNSQKWTPKEGGFYWVVNLTLKYMNTGLAAVAHVYYLGRQKPHSKHGFDSWVSLSELGGWGRRIMTQWNSVKIPTSVSLSLSLSCLLMALKPHK